MIFIKKFDYKIFLVLFFSVFAVVTGVGIVVPLLQVYVFNIGSSGFYTGLVFGSFSLSRLLCLFYFGKVSDEKGRKPYIVGGLLFYLAISIAFILSKSVGMIIVIRFMQGVASAMIMPVIQAYIGDITPRGSEGWIMGLFNLSMFIGLSVGPIIGGVIDDQLGIEFAFLCMGILSLIGSIFCFLYLPFESKEKITKKKISWFQILRDRVIIGLFFVRLTHTIGIGIIWSFFPILSYKEYGLSSSLTGFLIMLGVSVSAIVHIPMGWFSDKINRKFIILFGGITVAISLYYFSIVRGFFGLFCCNLFFGIGGGIMTPALLAAGIVRGKYINAIGSTMALLTIGHSAGMLFGSFVAGLMVDLFDLRRVFPIGAGVMLIGVILFIIFTNGVDLSSRVFSEKSRLSSVSGC